MSATTTKPRKAARSNGTVRKLTRQEAADELLPLLGPEPETEIAFRQQLNVGPHSNIAGSGLRVLEARGLARKVPHPNGKMGWVAANSPIESVLPDPQSIEWLPNEHIKLSECFVPDYQRPVTSLVNDIRKNFSIYLWGGPIVSDRGRRHPGGRYALIDGQTRWRGAMDIGIVSAPFFIVTKLTPQQEAELFVDIQLKRKGITSWFRFRGQLFAENTESLAIQDIAKSAGWELGDGVGQIKAVAALEATYRATSPLPDRQGDILLERVLVNLASLLPEGASPDNTLIRGMHYLFRNYPINEKVIQKKAAAEIDDQRLVRKLQTAGMRKLRDKAGAAKDMGAKSNAEAYGKAMEIIYKG